MVLLPASWGALNRPSTLREFNPCHEPSGSGKGGEFAGKGTCAGGPGGLQRLPVILVSNIDEAVALILQGKVVELPDVRRVHTILTKLAAMARDAKAKGQAAPVYDLCKVSVPGTNLFCGSKLRSAEFPDGVPRIKMPQLGGVPLAGTDADKLPRNAWDTSEVDGAGAFIAHLASFGIRTSRGTEQAARLRASQSELVGSKVALMMDDASYDPAKNPIFVSRDHYVVDGHHRWAAMMGRDAADGVLGDKRMNVIRVNAPISELLHIANKWSLKFGIKPAAGPKRKGVQ